MSDPDRSIPDVLVTELRRAIHRGARVATICSGAFILALTGALDGQVATTHWKLASELARRFPAITPLARRQPRRLLTDVDTLDTLRRIEALH
jgi:transcriptional regulator GlxA family with amidase domain